MKDSSIPYSIEWISPVSVYFLHQPLITLLCGWFCTHTHTHTWLRLKNKQSLTQKLHVETQKLRTPCSRHAEAIVINVSHMCAVFMSTNMWWCKEHAGGVASTYTFSFSVNHATFVCLFVFRRNWSVGSCRRVEMCHVFSNWLQKQHYPWVSAAVLVLEMPAFGGVKNINPPSYAKTQPPVSSADGNWWIWILFLNICIN